MEEWVVEICDQNDLSFYKQQQNQIWASNMMLLKNEIFLEIQKGRWWVGKRNVILLSRNTIGETNIRNVLYSSIFQILKGMLESGMETKASKLKV